MKKRIFFVLFFVSIFCIFNFYAQKPEEQAAPLQNITQPVSQNQSSLEKKEKFFSTENLKKIFSPKASKIYILLLAFILGILVSFTPCVYPMIPITIGILQTQASTSLLHNFLLSCSYALGVSTIYAILGYVVATTGMILGQWLASPLFVSLLIVFFIYLAFSMFGFYEIYIPRFLQRQANVSVKGSFFYSFLFGVISGTVASPCLSAPLAILLSFVAKLKSPVYGFLILWFFALGMGLLLVLIGTFSTLINAFPKSGTWMLEIKKFFGFVIFGMCVYFVQPFFSYFIILKLYAILFFVAAVYYFATAQRSKIKFFLGIIFGVIAFVILFFGLTQKAKYVAQNSDPDFFIVQTDKSENKLDGRIKHLKVYKTVYNPLLYTDKSRRSRLI
jgi:thioredoxin:protein disulfide reductase